MTDFKIELINLLETSIPELRDKIQAGAVDAETQVPYVAYSTPEEVPIRTIHGIAGYTTTFELAVFHNKLNETEKLRHRIIKALEGEELCKRHCYLKSSSYNYYSDYDLHGYIITFKIV